MYLPICSAVLGSTKLYPSFKAASAVAIFLIGLYLGLDAVTGPPEEWNPFENTRRKLFQITFVFLSKEKNARLN